ncbi:hypothetical protein LJC33_07700 [Eubacteriales bacterium OttesenSCG-928-N13]|nr:hypothetical protein [Eubacteriales bacterium OttesenSCG-928-N13]
MPSTSQLIQKAIRTRNMLRPGPMEKPGIPKVIAAQPNSFTPQLETLDQQPPPPRSAYMELMKKHDSIRPRI